MHYKPKPTEVKDLLDFMHDKPAPIAKCSGCGLLIRHENAVANGDDYEEDPNDFDLMRHVYPRYLEAFQLHERPYRPLLRPHAEVVELGSHLGAFLQAAEEWNWRPTGFDVGEDTTVFARGLGLNVRRRFIEDVSLGSSVLDAVFIWNCFEQLPEPRPLLANVHKALRRSGLLIIRVPSGAAYQKLHVSNGAHRKVLAYNNLLGFPYLYGYSDHTLHRLLTSTGFAPHARFGSELVTMPFPDLPSKLEQEQKAVSAFTQAANGGIDAPWIELVYRKATARDALDASRKPLVTTESAIFIPRAG